MANKDFVVKNGIVVNTSFSANSTTIALGLTSTNTVINTSTISIGGNVIANSTGANNAFRLGGTLASGYQTTAGLAANVATLTSNNSLYLNGTTAAGYQTTAGLADNVATLTANNTSYVGSVSAANVVSNAQLTANLANYALKTGVAFTGQVNSSANVNVTGSGVFVGNGAGLTSVSYVSTETNSADIAIFDGTDKNTWKDGSKFYPTIPSGVNTLSISVSSNFFIKQVANVVSSTNDITAGPGNPQLLYRIVKVPAAGSNTVLYTSGNNVLSTPGSGGGFLVNTLDTTPVSGNGTAYGIQYYWQSIDADPNANAGTISVSATNTPTVTGSGTYFTGTLNSRLQIARNSAPTTWKDISYISGNQNLTLEANWGNQFTAATYRVQDPNASVIMDQTDIYFTFVGYK